MNKALAILYILCSCFLMGFFINSCRKSDTIKPPTALTFTIPSGFPAPVYTFQDNKLTQEGFDLGKKLFYDGRLSKDGNFPCASCHQQFAGFATFDHDFSHGFNDQFTTHNSPGLFNLAWHKEFHWDGGINHIEVQPLAPITAPNEMAEDVNNVLQKFRQDNVYQNMFRSAFGDTMINSQRMLKALAQFVGSLVSADSKYDKVKKGQASFTTSEQDGYLVFKAKCETCHKEPLFTDLSYRNNGITLHSFLKDAGRIRITGKKEDSLKFKVPSLRNVMLTFPYMHDGRYYYIDNVLDHYTKNIVDGPTLDPLLKGGISLSLIERATLKAFLSTLTDSTFIKDPRFAEVR